MAEEKYYKVTYLEAKEYVENAKKEKHHNVPNVI
jgi:hypothetical protein